MADPELIQDEQEFTPPPLDAGWEDLASLSPREFAAWTAAHGAGAIGRIEAKLEEDAAPLDLPEDPSERQAAIADIVDRFAPATLFEAEGLVKEAMQPGASLGPRLRAEIHGLREAAQNGPPDERAEIPLRRAGALVAAAKSAAEQARPFGPVVRTHQFTAPDGSLRTTVTGRRTVEVERLTPQEVAEREAASTPPPSEPLHEVNPDIVSAWSAERWARFAAKYPDVADRVLQGRSVTESDGFAI